MVVACGMVALESVIVFGVETLSYVTLPFVQVVTGAVVVESNMPVGKLSTRCAPV